MRWILARNGRFSAGRVVDPRTIRCQELFLFHRLAFTSELLPPVDRCSVDSCRDDLHCDDVSGVVCPDRPLEITVFSGLKYELCLSAL